MSQFMGDIAGMLEIFAVAAGLALLHRASREAPAGLLKAAGLVLVIGGIGVGICTTWYWLSYQRAGGFLGAGACHAAMAPGTTRGGPMMQGGGPAPAGDPGR